MRTGKIKELIITQLQSKKGKLNELLLEYSLLAQNKLNPAREFMTKLSGKYPEINKFIISATSILALNRVQTSNQAQMVLPVTLIYLYFKLIAGGKDKDIENSVQNLTKEELKEGFEEFQRIILGKLSEWESYIKECGIDYLPKTIFEVNRKKRKEDKKKFLRGLAPSWNVIIDSLDIERNEEGEIKKLLEHDKNTMLLGNSGSGKSILMMRAAYDLMRDYAVFFSNGQIDSRKAIQFISEPEFSEKKKVIFIDNIVLNKSEVLNLLMETGRKSINVNFVFAAQKERWAISRESLTVYNFKEIDLKLTDKVKKKYVDRYLKSKDKDQMRYILRYARNVFPLLVLMTSKGRASLKKLIQDIWNTIKVSETEKMMMKTIFICSKFETSISEELIKKTYKDGTTISSLSEKGLIGINNSFISTYHPFISEIMLKEKYRTNNEDILNEVKKLAKIPSQDKNLNFFLSLGINITMTLIYRRGLKKDKKLISASEMLFKKAIDINSNNVPAHIQLGLLLMGDERIREAEVELKKALSIDENNLWAHNALGIYFNETGKLKEAEEEYRKAIEMDPSFADAHCSLGKLLKENGKKEAAEEEFRKAIQIDPSFADAYIELGVLLTDRGQLKEAEKQYREAIKINPRCTEGLINLGSLLGKLSKIKEAEKMLKKAIIINPNDADAHNTSGILFDKCGKTEKAESEFKKAINIEPDNMHFHYNLGLFLKNHERIKEAEKEYREAIKINPNNADVHLKLGVILNETERIKEAEEEYREAIKIKKDFALAHYNLGNILFLTKRMKEAEKEYREGIKINPKSGWAHMVLGFILIAIKKDHDGAMFYLCKAKRIALEQNESNLLNRISKILKEFNIKCDN